MKLKKLTRAFTLIELLVVITIIGILATGAVSVYTSQIQKARDSTRITSLTALKASVEQVYQDLSEYPHSDEFVLEVQTYLENFPKDPKHSQPCNNGGAGGVDCGFAYIVGDDDNGIEFGTYELSTAFENEGNLDARAKEDSGADNLRLEIGINTDTNASIVAEDSITALTGVCTLAGTESNATSQLITINGNPTATITVPADNECG